jgi:toxin ParE1/3/4
LRSSRAREDLKGIWRYTFAEWGEAQADKYLAEPGAGIARLREHPELGRPREDVRPGYRSLRINEHIVYYTITPSVIRIVRILHVRMDPDTHL